MNILILQIFISLILVAGSVVLFVHTVRSRTLEHTDRLALAPLEDDAADASNAADAADAADAAGSAGDASRNTGGGTGEPATKGEAP